MKKDFSKFKVLGITLLVTMSSCVAGSMELNAETLRTYGLELDITSTDKTHAVGKQKKSKTSSNSKFRITNIIESGRTHMSVAGLSIDYSPIVYHLRFQHQQNLLINQLVTCGHIDYSGLYHGINTQNRAGPFAQLG